jgi:serine/threonine-protein kinase
MRRTWLVCLTLLLAVAPASARHHHHRHGHGHGHSHYFFGFSVDPPGRHDRAEARQRSERTRSFIPADWQLAPPDPKWNGKRFVSPDGQAWFAAYSTDAAKEPIDDHMRAIAFAGGETLTYIRGESDWIAVSGTKGDRVFYRKAVVACGGRAWHQIAFEYPITMRRYVDPMVQRASAAVDATDEGCDAPAAKDPPAQVQQAPATTTGSAPSP